MADPLKLLILGAHPDDADISAGGLASIYRRLGHTVKMVSVTNGESGHHKTWGAPLVQRRRAEAAAAGAVIGAEYVTWDNRDGYLAPTLELRFQVIREIRTFKPDLVLTHRTNDYHPDHRAVGDVVRDASYMVTVPSVLPETPALRRDPVVAFMPDRFTKPTQLAGDVVVDITAELERIVDMLACHVSQFYEWLPYNMRVEDQLPADNAGKKEWLRRWYLSRIRPQAERYRAELVRTYGAVRGSQIEYTEAFEVSEYAAPLDAAARERLFGFLPHWKTA
jgi:LmbE family N-acetylglucosaminyl deacetylase